MSLLCSYSLKCINNVFTFPTILLLQVEEKLAELKRQYDEKLAQKEELKAKAEMLELKLDRAAKLVSGLAGERVRWEESVKVQQEVYSQWNCKYTTF